MPMRIFLVFLTAAVFCLASMPQAQSPDYQPQARHVPGKKLTFTYKFPAGLKRYECCTPDDPAVLAPAGATPGATADGTTAITRFPGKGALASTGRMLSSCTDLSGLTALERLRRSTTAYRGTCNQFAIYDHIVCTCENSCADANTFSCNCPGVPPGELPVIRPQDSLGSQPELIAETCTPCNELSSCNGF